MESKKFKDLKIGDVIYYCDCSSKFNKNEILNGNVLKIKTFKIDKIVYEKNFVTIQDYHLGRSLCLKSNVMKAYKPYHIYSTSKDFIEKEIKNYFKCYIASLKYKIKEGKKAEKDFNELLKTKSLW